jgi:hypothetical protein
MNYYEPFQRLDCYNYIKQEDALYVKASVSVYLPKGISLMGKMPVKEAVNLWTIEYIATTDQSHTDPYTFVNTVLIKVMDHLGLSSATNAALLKQAVQNVIKAAVTANGDFTVNCKVTKADSSLGGQVTNTIANQGEVVIL